MRRLFLYVLIFCTVSLSAQESSIYGFDKRWSLKTGVGYSFVPSERDRGCSLWWEATYSKKSQLEFHTKLNYSSTTARMTTEEIEMLWPSEYYNHQNERRGSEYYLLELGVSYPFIVVQRHRIAPGAGLSLSYERIWRPSHSWAVPIDRLNVGVYEYYGSIGEPFYNSTFTLYFALQLEYTFHFNNGFFLGARCHAFYDFTLPFVTISPVLGVRF